MTGLTLHDVATGTHPIGIECDRCVRRVVVTAAALKAVAGDHRTLEQAGVARTELDLIAVTIALSIILHSSTDVPVAHMLRIEPPDHLPAGHYDPIEPPPAEGRSS